MNPHLTLGALFANPSAVAGLWNAPLPEAVTDSLSRIQETALREEGFDAFSLGHTLGKALEGLATLQNSDQARYSRAAQKMHPVFHGIESLFGTTPTAWDSMDKIFEESAIPATPLNRQVFLLAAGIQGLKLALDLDGTLIDYAVEKRLDGGYDVVIQVKPGAEAMIAGLALHNRLLLYTARETAQVAAIFQERKAFRKAFAPFLDSGKPVRAEDVFESPNVFSLADWIQVMSAILTRNLEEAAGLTDLERKMGELWRLFKNAPFSLLHLKLPEFARMRGKHDFDWIADDSNGLKELLGFLKMELGVVGLPYYPHLDRASALGERRDNIILKMLLSLQTLAENPAKARGVAVEKAAPLHDVEVVKFRIAAEPALFHQEEWEALEALRRKWIQKEIS